jgi:2-polyprenyl-3-methyl-5-hydroxy-6-metoxy-1,4-benzoquinol methylase
VSLLPITSKLEAEFARTGFGPSFRAQYLDGFFRSIGAEALLNSSKSVVDLLQKAPPDLAGIIYYVLSTVDRGRMMAGYGADKLGPGKRFLDVGCGFGGSLRGAQELGATVHGIEIDPTRLAAARALMADSGIPAMLEPCDIFTPCFDNFPTMHVIVSENVIEHVDDPRRFIETMFHKLEPGGTLVLEIPNARALRSATSDPHYHLPFITLMSYESAKKLFDDLLKVDQYGQAYSVGDYFPLSWYKDVLGPRAAKTTVTYRADALQRIEDVPALLTGLDQAHARAKTLYASLASALLREEAMHKADVYVAGVKAAYEACMNSGGRNSPNFAAFEETYLAPAWILRFDKP